MYGVGSAAFVHCTGLHLWIVIPLSTLEDLYIFEDQIYPPCWQDDVENTLWLDLLRLFVAVKDLYLSEEFVPRIAPDPTIGVRV